MKSPTDPKRRRIALAALLGAVLALICPHVPHDYQAACNLLATICSGGSP